MAEESPHTGAKAKLPCVNDKPEKKSNKNDAYTPISAEPLDLAKSFIYWESMWKENKILRTLKEYILYFLAPLTKEDV